ncbi:MAG: hypothetical protein HY722_11155 [Planctomycetes bacterium]|nr:hypothetical protein [Planctomycetota bacterium]
MRKRERARASGPRGSVYIFVLGVLSLLAILGAAMVSTTHIEKVAAGAFLDTVRAELVARQGVERVAAELGREEQARSTIGPRPPWLYRSAGGTATAAEPGLGQPLDDRARHLSYPTRRTVGGVDLDVSGVAGGTYVQDGDTYLLKVLDAAGQLHLNGPQASLGLMLEVLGRAIVEDFQRRFGEAIANPVPTGLGRRIVDYRNGLPGRRLSSKQQLRTLMPLADFERLADYVTVQGWADPGTVAPDDPPDEVLDRQLQTEGTSLFVEYPRTFRFRSEARYPVNINSAPMPVLAALFCGLYAYEIDRRALADSERINLYSQDRLIAQRLRPISYEEAVDLADLVIAHRATTPFPCRAAFVDWLATSVVAGNLEVGPTGATLSSIRSGIVVAATGPDLRFSLYTPSHPVFTVVEKATVRYNVDQALPGTAAPGEFNFLESGTTELCYSSMGYYEVQCLGQVRGPRSEVLSERTLTTVVKLYDVYRHSNQRDFEQAAAAAAGDPDDIPFPGEAGVMTFPEAVSAVGPEGASASDGFAQLSTEWREEDESDAGAAQTFLAGFRHSLAADQGAAVLSNGAGRGDLIAYDTSPFEQGTLAPDGLVTRQYGPGQANRSEAYSFHHGSQGNLPYQEGTVELWVKLAVEPRATTFEALLYGINQVESINEGVAWRLERWGQRLVSTRLRWTYPEPFQANESNYPYTWSECVADVTAWAPDEWHHVVVTWGRRVSGEGSERHRLYVDGVEAPPDFRVAPRETTTRKVPMAGSGSNVIYQEFIDTVYNNFRLGTYVPENRILFGGYGYTWDPPSGTASARIKGSTGGGTPEYDVQKGTTYHRFSNCTVDEVRVFNRIRPPAWVLGTSRYNAASGPGLLGRFDLPAEPCKVGHVTWDLLYPAQWGRNSAGQFLGVDRNMTPYSQAFDQSVSVGAAPGSLSQLMRSTTEADPLRIMGGGFATGLSYQGGANQHLYYRWQVDGGPSPFNVSPALDSITITVWRGARQLSY